MQERNYLTNDYLIFRSAIRKFMDLRNADIAPEGILTKKLEEYQISRGIIVKLNPETVQECVSVGCVDAGIVMVADLWEINEVYYTDFCKHWKELMSEEGSIFLSVDKIIERFRKK